MTRRGPKYRFLPIIATLVDDVCYTAGEVARLGEAMGFFNHDDHGVLSDDQIQAAVNSCRSTLYRQISDEPPDNRRPHGKHSTIPVWSGRTWKRRFGIKLDTE